MQNGSERSARCGVGFSVGRGLALAFAIAAGLPAQEQPETGGDPEGLEQRAAVLSRHGITWHFDREYPFGTFANGDYWVLGPVQVVQIEPACIEVDGRVRHGSMIDPDPSQMLQGYDSHLFGDQKRERYRDELNVGRGVSTERPLALAAGSSLISVESGSDPNRTPTLDGAAVLTCLAEQPAPDAFRPPYVRGLAEDEALHYRAKDLDFEIFRRVKPTVDAPPIDVIASKFERFWLDHFPEWPVRYAHPRNNMPDYGRDIGALVGSGALALNFDVDADQKRTLLIRMTQIGLDLHAALRVGCHWRGLGGHGHGRKLPILLAGMALHDERMLAIGREFPSKLRAPGDGSHWFAEDGQTFYVRETSPGVWNWGAGGYTRDYDGLAEWGFDHASTTDGDNAVWDANPYRRCCTANGWVGQCLAARMLGLQETWKHPAWFDYMDRYMQVKHTDDWHRSWIGWHASMWDAYRANF
ncbi:MAG: hypothetical protein KDE27_27795 [Planctomycetes bacterium]|nr:hypothetical protein [Planctomycetota bacterium]